MSVQMLIKNKTIKTELWDNNFFSIEIIELVVYNIVLLSKAVAKF